MSGSLNRQPGFSETIITLSATSQVVIGPAPSRVQLTFCPPSAGAVTLSPGPTATLYRGVTLKAGDQPVTFTKARDGDLVTRGWSGISLMMMIGAGVEGVFEHWRIVASATAATATATRTGAAGQRSVVRKASWSFSAAATGLAQLFLGATGYEVFQLHNLWHVEYSHPLMADDAEDVSVVLASGGAGIQGRVVMQGYTVLSPVMTIYEVLPAGVARSIPDGGRMGRVW